MVINVSPDRQTTCTHNPFEARQLDTPILSTREDLRRHVEDLLEEWRQEGIPTRWGLQNIFREITEKRSSPIGLWESPPLMLTATLDDGWGNGLQIIETCARAMGLDPRFLGLLKSPEEIVSACIEQQPDLLGLTVLQFDSEPALSHICRHIPAKTRLIAGGAPFQIDPELAGRAGVHFVARNVADFLEFLLNFR